MHNWIPMIVVLTLIGAMGYGFIMLVRFVIKRVIIPIFRYYFPKSD